MLGGSYLGQTYLGSSPSTSTTSFMEVGQIEWVSQVTLRMALTPSSTDIKLDVDTSTVSLILTPLSSDSEQAVDAANIVAVITPSSSDAFTGVDANTVTEIITITSVEIYGTGDTATAVLTGTPSSSDTAQFADSATVGFVATPSSSDIRERFDSATISFVATPSSSDVAVFVDSNTAIVTMTPSSTDLRIIVDAATANVVLTPSETDVATFVDSGSASVVLTPSSTEAAQFADSATVRISLTPSSIDLLKEGLADTSATSTQSIDEKIRVFLLPVSDLSTGTWHDTPLYDKIDEVVPAPDYIESGNNPVNDTAVVALHPGDDPVTSADHFINVQFYKVESAPSHVDFIIRLKQGSTTITEQTFTDVSTAVTTMKIPLTSTEADSITDYGSLSFEIVANEEP